MDIDPSSFSRELKSMLITRLLSLLGRLWNAQSTLNPDVRPTAAPFDQNVQKLPRRTPHAEFYTSLRSSQAVTAYVETKNSPVRFTPPTYELVRLSVHVLFVCNVERILGPLDGGFGTWTQQRIKRS